MERSWKQGSARSTDVALSVLVGEGVRGVRRLGPVRALAIGGGGGNDTQPTPYPCFSTSPRSPKSQ